MQQPRTEIYLQSYQRVPVSYPRTPTALFNGKSNNILFDVDMQSLKSARPQGIPSMGIVAAPQKSAELQICCTSDDINSILHIDNLGLPASLD